MDTAHFHTGIEEEDTGSKHHVVEVRQVGEEAAVEIQVGVSAALGMICRRYLDNRDFIAKPYYLLQLRTTKAGKELVLTCTGKYDTPEKLDVDRKKVYEETTAKVVQVEKKEVPEEAPLLYDLTALQRSANTKLGLTAEQTLNIAQKLYEGGYISYPRTGCSYITEDIFEQVPSLIGVCIQPVYILSQISYFFIAAQIWYKYTIKIRETSKSIRKC